MDVSLARQPARMAFNLSRELQDHLRGAKDELEPHEYTDYALGVASAIDSMSAALLSPAIVAYPELAREIDDQIAAHGRYL